MAEVFDFENMDSSNFTTIADLNLTGNNHSVYVPENGNKADLFLKSVTVPPLLTSNDNERGKRGIRDVEESPINNKYLKSRKTDTIAPIIYFKLDIKYVEKKQDLENHLKVISLEQNIIIRDLKVTANRNLMLFPQSIDDKSKLLSSNSVFPDLKKLDLGLEERRHVIVLKGAKSSLKKYFFS
jgi:hypothetical protein